MMQWLRGIQGHYPLMLAGGVACLAMAGCGPSGERAERQDTSLQAVAQPNAGLREFMVHVIQRNAFELWGWQAYISDDTGDYYTLPKTDEDWELAESDAMTVAELARLLESPPYRVDDPDWPKHVAKLREVASQSAAAAEKHDSDAFLASGAKVNDACLSCHYRFAPQLEAPPPE